MLKPSVYVSVLELVESSKSGRFFAQAFEDEDAPPSAGDRGRSIRMLELPLEVKGT